MPYNLRGGANGESLECEEITYCGEKECFAICAQSDAVGTECTLRDGHAGTIGERVDGFAPDDGEEACLGVDVACAVEVAP